MIRARTPRALPCHKWVSKYEDSKCQQDHKYPVSRTGMALNWQVLTAKCAGGVLCAWFHIKAVISVSVLSSFTTARAAGGRRWHFLLRIRVDDVLLSPAARSCMRWTLFKYLGAIRRECIVRPCFFLLSGVSRATPVLCLPFSPLLDVFSFCLDYLGSHFSLDTRHLRLAADW